MENYWSPCRLKFGSATETFSGYTLSSRSNLVILPLRVCYETALLLEHHLKPSTTDAGHRHLGLSPIIRHLHVKHTLVSLSGQHVNVLLTAVGHVTTIRRAVAQSFQAALGRSDLHLRSELLRDDVLG